MYVITMLLGANVHRHYSMPVRQCVPILPANFDWIFLMAFHYKLLRILISLKKINEIILVRTLPLHCYLYDCHRFNNNLAVRRIIIIFIIGHGFSDSHPTKEIFLFVGFVRPGALSFWIPNIRDFLRKNFDCLWAGYLVN